MATPDTLIIPGRRGDAGSTPVRASRTPPPAAFTAEERGILHTRRTPAQVQAFVRALPYNWETDGPTLRTFRGVVRHREAHCLEAVLAAATILEQHGFPPLVLDLESQDGLDHVLMLFRIGGRWGAIGKSRDAGLHGRRPAFRTIRALVYSYVDPYVDGSGRIVGYGVGHLDELVRGDWRLGERNVWEVERALYRLPHTRLRTSEDRYERMLRRFLAFKRSGRAATPAALRSLYGAAVDRWL